ncbi:uncharacterized protein LOC109859580 [Pseudomyrmex gracilis]|uniref:uncharacterized protein LOC109859580 n=1 Tax=Pseudomyrmex gracilis TaxID=219809 RepID=UPI000995C878|nr:uncharacterized protein LOC109859580 [Pseudomyrmex gracilis]
MGKINNHTDSSSEDEIPTSVLREIIDQDFLNDNLYSTEKNKIVPQSESSKLKKRSLRLSSNQENQFTNFGVTSEFQAFVAQKLDEMLERTIKLKNKKFTKLRDVEQKVKRKQSGIKLLSTSKTLLTAKEVTEIPVEQIPRPKKHKKHYEISENEDDLAKIREAAVDAEFIFSGSETKAWSDKRSDLVFKYKILKDGTLEQIV